MNLFEYQEIAVEKFFANKGRLLCAMPTGTGKTIVATAIIEKEYQQNKKIKILIITPAGLKFNFIETFRQHKLKIPATEVLDARLLEDYYKDYNALIISYNFLRGHLDQLLQLHFDLLVIDEFHYAKNAGGSTSKSILAIRKNTPQILAMTASPYSNNPTEFVNLLYIVSLDKALSKYIAKEQIVYKAISVNTPLGKRKKIMPSGLKNPLVVRRLLNPWIFWPSDKTIAKSKPNVQPRYFAINVEITPEEYAHYKYAIGKIPPYIFRKLVLGTITPREINMIMGWLIAGQETLLSPSYLTGELPAKPGSKIKFLGELIKKKGGKSIVFSSFVQYGIDPTVSYLNKIGIKTKAYIGAIKRDERTKLISEFEEGDLQVLCISTAGAEGINLPSAKNVYFLNAHFNPEVLKQIEGRALRITSKNDYVNMVYMLARYHNRPLIDEWILNIAKAKQVFRNNIFQAIQESRFYHNSF
jgi:superfamily II DNA or RNA helicase